MEILKEKKMANIDITSFYNKKIEFLKEEINLSNKIRGVLEQNIEKLKGEIVTLTKIVRTGRNHFKELETCDYESLH